MVTLSTLKTQTAKKLNGETAASPSYSAFGTGTATPTRADTALATETGRKVQSSASSQNNVSYTVTDLTNIDTTFHTALTETGIADSSSGANLLTRQVHGAFTPAPTKTCRVTQFQAITPASNNNKNILTKYVIDSIAAWLAGTTFPATPSYVAWGALKILDQCDSLGGGGNAWNTGGQGSAAALDTTNFVEGAGAIDMGKSGTGGTTFYYDRTLAATVDLSSATNLRVYVRVDDTATRTALKSTGCLKVWFGIDSSNYREYSVDQASLIVGWQQLDLPISLFTTTGTVDLSLVKYMRLTWETTNATDTITSGKLIMDYWGFWWKLNYSDTALHQEITRQALTAASTRQSERVIFTSTVPRASGNTYQYEYVALFDASSNGNMWLSLEITPFQKNAVTLVTHETDITVTIKDY